MPDKLTDAEIVKALEICTTYKGKCTDCPAFVKVDKSNCKKFFKGAIDLIKRLQAEINHLDNESDALLADIDFRDTENKKLQAENERLKEQIKVGDKIYEDVCNEFDNDLKIVNEKLKTAKAEAYKEFAVRLKKTIEEEIYTYYNDIGGGYYLAEDVLPDIDNLLKELVGEDK